MSTSRGKKNVERDFPNGTGMRGGKFRQEIFLGPSLREVLENMPRHCSEATRAGA
jgi:hypothetical protein